METEQEMRKAVVPSFNTLEELSDYIKSLTEREHDYGTCVYAMSMAATAAFEFVAGKLGVTGFQASMADLDIIRRTRMMECPFMLIKGSDALYPQYDLHEKLSESMVHWKPWLAKEAERLLKVCECAHPDVIAHWENLIADGAPVDPQNP